MNNFFEQRKQDYQRMVELCQISRQRYLEAGGNPQRSSGTLHNNDSLTEEEKQEFFALGQQLTKKGTLDTGKKMLT